MTNHSIYAITAGIAVIFFILMVGCEKDYSEEQPTPEEIEAIRVEANEYREADILDRHPIDLRLIKGVECIVIRYRRGTGISCNWAKYNQEANKGNERSQANGR